MDKIKIILVDDHQIIRDGIIALLKNVKDIEITGAVADVNELHECLKSTIPDILILDISLPEVSGIEITKEIKEKYPDIKILILTMYTNESFIFSSLEAGANGYLPKNTSKKEILKAIYSLHKGEDYYNATISNIILSNYIKRAKISSEESNKNKPNLTKREVETLQLIGEGLSNKEIADRLYISIRTVESHKRNIMQKLELKTIVDLIKFAIKNNIIKV